eukprot:4894892-Ditylum_brightwellii.AAC.1
MQCLINKEKWWLELPQHGILSKPLLLWGIIFTAEKLPSSMGYLELNVTILLSYMTSTQNRREYIINLLTHLGQHHHPKQEEYPNFFIHKGK